MANYTEEQLLSVIKILAGEQDEKNKDSQAAEEAAAAAAKAKAEEEAEEKARAEAAAAAEGSGKDEDKEKEKSKVSDDREDKFIAKSIRAGLTAKGIDADLVDSLSEFVAYDTLKNEAGEADDALVEKLVDSLSSLALRKPPAGGSDKRDILNSNQEGLRKYLPQNDK